MFITEFVDHDDRPTTDPHTIDRVLVTSLFGRTLPLICYGLTDVPVSSDRLCSRGAAFPLIETVKGRSDDIFVYRGDIHVHPLVFRAPLGQNSRIEQYQCIRPRLARGSGFATAPIDVPAWKQELAEAVARTG